MWVVQNASRARFIVLASATRIESLRLLRLQLCGTELMMMPMEPKHFLFLQSAGKYHLLTEDIPHALVAWVRMNQCFEWIPWIPASCDAELLAVGISTVGCLSAAVGWALGRQALQHVQRRETINTRHRTPLTRLHAPLVDDVEAEQAGLNEGSE